MNPQALHDIFNTAGPQAAHIADLWWLTVAICAVVFVAVMGALVIALRRAPRADPSTPPDLASLNAPEPRVRRSVISAVALSIVLLIVLMVASFTTDRALAKLALQDALHIEVTANQWWWAAHYDDADPSRTFDTANELHIPTGRPVVITLKSNDVIHSLWIPNLHGKKDLIPGQVATMQLRADTPGVYRGQCAEFCGLQHAFMALDVTASAPTEYEQWAQQQRQSAPEPSGAQEKRGRELFLGGSCMLCHAIDGTTAGARRGPNLTHVASRASLAAGRLTNTPENLAAWITDPQKHKPGANMPAHPLPEADLQALVAYLETLK
jgi:cytochrome c oxidase subunit 2